MQEEVRFASAADLQPDDIIFECPQCGKSLAIDVRGAGYIVRCPDCQTEIQVPGVDVSPASPAGEGTSKDIQESQSGMQARLQQLERLRSLDAERFKQISGELSLIQAALDRLVGLIDDAQSGESSGSA